MMNIEIHHRDAIQPVPLPRMLCGNGDGAEKAEPNRSGGLGMMAGRTRGDKGIAGLARDHHVHRRQRSSHPAQRRAKGARRHEGIGIELRKALFGLRFADMRDIGRRMGKAQIRLAGQRGLAAQKRPALQRCQKAFQPRRAFGVPRRRHMGKTVFAGEKGGGHGLALLRLARVIARRA